MDWKHFDHMKWRVPSTGRTGRAVPATASSQHASRHPSAAEASRSTARNRTPKAVAPSVPTSSSTAGAERRTRQAHPPEKAGTRTDELYIGTLLRREGRNDQVIRRKSMRPTRLLVAMAGSSLLCCVAFGLASLFGASLPHTGSNSLQDHPLWIVPADSPAAPANLDTLLPGRLQPPQDSPPTGQRSGSALAQPGSGSAGDTTSSAQRGTAQTGDQNVAHPSAAAGHASAPTGASPPAPSQPSSAPSTAQPPGSSPSKTVTTTSPSPSKAPGSQILDPVTGLLGGVSGSLPVNP
jgi:hypothetical protein